MSGIEEIDLSGLACPFPLVKLKQLLSKRGEGAFSVKLMMTDKAGLKDIPAFCRQKKLQCQLDSYSPSTNEIVFLITG